MIDLRAIRKATGGVQYRFFWMPDDGYPESSPSVVIRSTTTALSPVHASLFGEPANTTSITFDQTISSEFEGLIDACAGEVWIDADQTGQLRATIKRFTTTSTAELTQPLPFPISGIATQVTIHPLLYSALLPASVTDLGSEAFLRLLWSVSWTMTRGADHPTEPRRDEGMIFVVRQPFRTGCSPRNLLSLVPSLARQVPPEQTSWWPQIREAEDELCLWLAEVIDSDKLVDDVLGEPFRRVHALLSAAIILESQAASGWDRSAVAEDYRTRARADFDRLAKRMPYMDADRDGEIDEGEAPASATGLGGLFRSYHTSNDFDADAFDRDHRVAIDEDR